MKRFRTVLRFVPAYKRAIVLGILSLVAARGLDAWFPKILGSAVDAFSKSPLPMAWIRDLALLALGVGLVRGFFQFFMRWFLITTSRHLERDLRNRLYGHLLTLDPAFYDHRATGDLMSRASSDIEQVRLAIGPGIMYMSNTIVLVPVALVLMLDMSVPLTLLSMIPLAGIALITRILAPRMQRHSRRVQEAAADLSTRAQESFTGARVVKVFAREENEVDRFHAQANDYLKASMGLAKIRTLFRPSLQALEGVASLVLLFGGGWWITGGSLSVGSLMEFFAYQRMLIWPMISVGYVIALFQRGAAAMIRIDEILDTSSVIADPPEPAPRGPAEGEIDFRGLTFSYNGTPVLEDVDLHVPAGSTLAVVGATGAGKTTLIELLLRLYPVPDGMIVVDGTDVNRYRVADLRAAIGFVPQETFLFSDTLKENIGYGVPDLTEGQALDALQRSQLAAEVATFPNGADTMLGERGVNLSGGQKQRAALARAIVRRPPILILDDAFSSVDTQTEDRILKEIADVMAGRTTILIGHRVSTVKHADHIVVLERGRIVEEGTHGELLSLGGRYARMERLQRLQEEIDTWD